MDWESVLRGVGYLLLAVGGVSGVSLMFRAMFGFDCSTSAAGTLWGLFIVGLSAGIAIFVLARL